MPQSYRRIKQIVHAIQLTEDNAPKIAAWCGGDIVEEIDPRDDEKRYQAINVPTRFGNQRLSLGQFLLKDPHTGQFSIVDASTFMSEYEPDR